MSVLLKKIVACMLAIGAVGSFQKLNKMANGAPITASNPGEGKDGSGATGG